MGEAMQHEQAWEKGNKYAGKLCLFEGLAFFVLLPLCLFLTGASKGWLLAAYFTSAVVYTLLAVFLPVRILKHKFENWLFSFVLSPQKNNGRCNAE